MFGLSTKHSVTIGLGNGETVSRQNLHSSNDIPAILYIHALDCWPQNAEVPTDPVQAVNTYFGTHAPREWFEVTKSVSWLGVITTARTVHWGQPSDVSMV